MELTDSLAVKYRPRKFSDIVGNSSNIKTITGFLQKGQLPRTWLFSGNPGCGKTTSARILAMTVNCENIGENIKKGIVEPCLTCNSCKLALQNKHPDIFEMNAGGEEGNVQGIRDMLNNMKLSPRFNVKCFIMDECLPGDTEVLLEDGTTVTLYELMNNNTYKVLSYNTETNEIETDNITNTGKFEDREVVEVQLEDGSKQVCSPNHKWWSVTRNKYVYAEDLIEGEELLVIED